jgi:hypothetical protein
MSSEGMAVQVFFAWLLASLVSAVSVPGLCIWLGVTRRLGRLPASLLLLVWVSFSLLLPATYAAINGISVYRARAGEDPPLLLPVVSALYFSYPLVALLVAAALWRGRRDRP